MQINLIFARAANGVIGKQNALPWHLPEDLAHFKRLTSGWPVIMGRKTWDSLPPRFRPLPGRKNVVVTRQADSIAEGATCANSLTEALALCADSAEVWIIGGAQLYALAEPIAHRAEVTQIEQDFAGDAFAPTLGATWVETARSNQISAGSLTFSFVTYTQTPGPSTLANTHSERD